MSINILEDIDSCNIDSQEEYQAFLAKLRKVAKGHNPASVIQEFITPSNTCIEQAKGLIYLAVQDTDVAVSQTTLNSILLSDNNFGGCLTAACLYLVTQRADDDAYLRELLLAQDSFTSPKASREARYYLIKFMGISDNTSFVDLLGEILTKHYHFCDQSFTATTLKTLGASPDEEEIPYTRSIRIGRNIDSGIIIHTDDKYTGSSECPKCSFFPCRINHYYAGGIEACKLWNKIDPETAGEIIDKRDWGQHLVSEKVDVNQQQKKTWKQARKFMEKKLYNQAIPYLCSSMLLQEQWTAESKSRILPLAWIYLSQCFSKNNEKGLAFIAMREALQYQKLIPKHNVPEQRQLQAFDDNPVTILDKIMKNKSFINYQAINYKKRKQWVKAFDCYVHDNICRAGKGGDNWFNMGECCQKLGELHLAKFFMYRAVATNPDRGLDSTFSKGGNDVNELLLLENKDIGLSLERRKQERTPVPAKIEYGFRLDTYKFEEISPAAKQATLNCHGVRDYFKLSRAVYEHGDLELAIEIMKAAVNHTPFDYGSKAHFLHRAARLYLKIEAYDKAKKYLDWAIELKPEDEDIRKLYTYLTKLTPFRKFLLKNGYIPNYFTNILKDSLKRLKESLMQLRKRPKKIRTGQGKLLKTFTVYKNDKVVEVVGVGFSWPAFFFTWIWAFVKKMYGLGTVGMLIFMVAVNTISIVNIGLLILLSLILGLKANEWKASHLRKRGFVKGREVITMSKEDAILACFKPELRDKQEATFRSMTSGIRKNCNHCYYEDSNRTLHATNENYPGPSYDFDFEIARAVWCNYHKRYIGEEDRHALKRLADGSVKENEWCKVFVINFGK
jgi:tetratricopeptide (TPR) repeat protein